MSHTHEDIIPTRSNHIKDRLSDFFRGRFRSKCEGSTGKATIPGRYFCKAVGRADTRAKVTPAAMFWISSTRAPAHSCMLSFQRPGRGVHQSRRRLQPIRTYAMQEPACPLTATPSHLAEPICHHCECISVIIEDDVHILLACSAFRH